MIATISENDFSRMFFFDDVNDKRYFFKQFLAGVFTMIAMTGLDQDMMQRNLSCKNFKDSQKNMITSGISQFFVILLFLMLGVLLYTFTAQHGIENPEKSDELFPMIATGDYFPAIVGVLFIIGLISSAYSAAGSALTALTTSFTVDILGAKNKAENELVKIRKRVHIGMAIIMVTHDLGVIASMCDEIIVMYGGRVCERGTADAIFYSPAHEYTKGLLRSLPTKTNSKTRLVPIGGTPINMLNMPEGCAFCPRCDAAMKICLTEKPEEIWVGEDHLASCWMNIKNMMEEGKSNE